MIVTGTILFLCLTHIIIPTKHLKKYYYFSALVLGIIATSYIPSIYDDLSRHYEVLHSFRNGWQSVINSYWWQTQPIFAIYMYIISLFNLDGLLPGITVFITYILIFEINFKILKRYRMSRIITNVNFLLIMSTLNYLSVMSGIRNLLVFSIFTFVLYYDLVEKKKFLLLLPIYVLASLIHNSVIIFIFLRILLLFKKNIIINFASILLIIWPLFIPFINVILNLFSNIGLVQAVQERLNIYLSGGGTSYILNTAIIRAQVVLILIFIIYFNFRKVKIYYKELDQYYKFSILVICFTIGSVIQYDIFVRSIALLIFMSPVIISGGYITKNTVKVAEKNLGNIIFLIIICVSALSLIFNTLSAYMHITFSVI